MTIQISAFKWVPPFAEGYVKDLRIRWALEEAGLPYETVLLGEGDSDGAVYRAWQPFGQVPAYKDDEVELFESGSILLHIASKSEALAPRDTQGKARVATWVIAALNSIEPQVQNLVFLDLFHEGEAWTEERRPQAEAMLAKRLTSLATWLGDNNYLEDRFTAGDLMMTTVLRDLREYEILSRFPTLQAYRKRCEARPAFARALDAQSADYRKNAPEASAPQ